MIVTRGFGISRIKGSIVASGFGKTVIQIIVEGLQAIVTFVLNITRKHEVNLER